MSAGTYSVNPPLTSKALTGAVYQFIILKLQWDCLDKDQAVRENMQLSVVCERCVCVCLSAGEDILTGHPVVT